MPISLFPPPPTYYLNVPTFPPVTSTPIPPPSTGMALWLKADAGVTLFGSQVGTWADQSGNGNDVNNGSSGSRPTLANSALNGLPAVNFTAGTFMERATSPVTSGSARSTIFVIAGTTGTVAGIVGYRSSSPLMSLSRSGYTDFAASQADALSASNPVPGVYEWYTTVGALPGLAQNGVTQVVSASFGAGKVTNDNGADGFVLGHTAAGDANSKVCEVVVYDHVLTSDQIQQVRAYLRARYAIALGAT